MKHAHHAHRTKHLFIVFFFAVSTWLTFPTLAMAELSIPEGELPTQVTTNADYYQNSTGDLAEDLFPKTKADKKNNSAIGISLFANDTVSITEPSATDVFAMGNTIQANEEIDGDLFAAGNTITVDENVDGSLRLAGNTVTVNGSIGRNVLIFGNTVHIARSAVIHGHATIFANTIVMEGVIEKTARLAGSKITINGTLTEKSSIEGQYVTIASKTTISAPAAIASSLQPTIQQGVEGEQYLTTTIVQDTKRAHDRKDLSDRLFGWLVSFFGFSILGIVLILLWPQWTKRVADTIYEKPFSSARNGVLYFVLVPLGALIIAFTLIGIPLSVLIMLLYFLSLVVARLFAGMALGKHFVNKRTENEKKQRVLEFIVGYFVLSIIMSLPWIGWLFCILVGVWSVGGVLETFMTQKQKPVVAKKKTTKTAKK